MAKPAFNRRSLVAGVASLFGLVVAGAELKALPPEEAIRHFEAKGKKLSPSFAWQDVWQAEHAHQFTVAKSAGFDVLEDIHGATLAAMKDGTTFADFKKRLRPILQEKGWWGRKEVVDPATGERVVAQLGSPRRLQIIFDTNMRMSYATGRWEQIQRVKAARPYLRYSAVMDGKTRPEHRAWHGTVLPVDHPWWNTHYPPNGWRCRCSIQQLGQADLDRYDYKVSDQAPASPTRTYQSPRTGEVVEVPSGIDPGFAYNPGRAATPKVDPARYSMPELGHQAAQLSVETPQFAQLLAGEIEGKLPVGYVDDELANAIGAKVRRVVLSDQTAAKQRERHPDLAPKEYTILPAMFRDGLVIQQAKEKLVFFRQAGRWYKAVVKAAAKGQELYVVSFHRVAGDGAKEIARELKRGTVVRPMKGE